MTRSAPSSSARSDRDRGRRRPRTPLRPRRRRGSLRRAFRFRPRWQRVWSCCQPRCPHDPGGARGGTRRFGPRLASERGLDSPVPRRRARRARAARRVLRAPRLDLPGRRVPHGVPLACHVRRTGRRLRRAGRRRGPPGRCGASVASTTGRTVRATRSSTCSSATSVADAGGGADPRGPRTPSPRARRRRTRPRHHHTLDAAGGLYARSGFRRSATRQRQREKATVVRQGAVRFSATIRPVRTPQTGSGWRNRRGRRQRSAFKRQVTRRRGSPDAASSTRSTRNPSRS